MQKLVLFGAGKIGRSFIAQLFSKAGFEVVFVDIDAEIIRALNEHRFYEVVFKSDKDEVVTVSNVRGILASNVEAVCGELADADIAAISIGQKAMPIVAATVAKGLIKRHEQSPDCPLDIILAENRRDAAAYFKSLLLLHLPTNYTFDKLVGLIETSIGKMVPIATKDDASSNMLRVLAEPYNQLILDKLAFKNPIPVVAGLEPKANMKAYVDRKLFIHNLGHVATAYFGYVYDNTLVYIWQVLEINEIRHRVYQVMQQAADALLAEYPDEFTKKQLTDHIEDLINRFRNKALGDTVYRVGCDLQRKLGPNDRICGAIQMALIHNLAYIKILEVLVQGFYFDATDNDGKRLPDDNDFMHKRSNGVEYILTNFCGFSYSTNSVLFDTANSINNLIIKYFSLKL